MWVQKRSDLVLIPLVGLMNLTESLPLGTEAPPPHWEEHRASHDMLFRTKPLHQVFASFSKEVEELDLSLVSWERLPGTHLK